MCETELNATLQEWLRLASEEDDILIDPDGAEANENMWDFSPSYDELNSLTVAAVTAFVERVIDVRREWLQRHHGGQPMRFYCWHDFQARQLCFSLISALHGPLPFGCVVKETDDLPRVIREIVELDWLNDHFHQVPPEEADDPIYDQPAAYTLLVYTQILP